MEMRRSLRGLCRLRGGKRNAFFVSPRTICRPPHIVALALLASLGCGSASSNLLAQGSASPEGPTVSRLQKPEETSRKAAAKGSLLDLVSFEVNVPGDSQVAARIRATVNGEPILDDEVKEGIYSFLQATQSLPEPERSNRRKEAFEKQLQQLIEQAIVIQDAKARLKDRPQLLEKLEEAGGKEFEKKLRQQKERLNIKSDDEFKAFLRQQGVSIEGVRRQVVRSFVATEYMKNLILPAIERIGHEQIAEYYQKHPEEFQIADGVTWQDIFIDANKFPNRQAARQFAEQLAAKARNGEDFHEMVLKYDQGDSTYRNGEGYGHHRGEIKPPQAEQILFNMRDSEIGPIIELTNGFHVIRLIKRQHAGIKPLDEKIQTAIRNKLQNEAWDREYKRVVDMLRRKASIEISMAAP
jgi:peptidyl-prolyl cis-trans isomerase SurA